MPAIKIRSKSTARVFIAFVAYCKRMFEKNLHDPSRHVQSYSLITLPPAYRLEARKGVLRNGPSEYGDLDTTSNNGPITCVTEAFPTDCHPCLSTRTTQHARNSHRRTMPQRAPRLCQHARPIAAAMHCPSAREPQCSRLNVFSLAVTESYREGSDA